MSNYLEVIDGKLIGIRTIQEKKSTSLCLDGTILSYREKSFVHTAMMAIPIELITIVEHKRFQGRRLIAAFASILLGLTLGAIFFAIISLGIDRAISDEWAGWVWGGSIIAGLISCFGFLIGFLFRQQTITLRVAPQDFEIEFWVQRGNSADIGKLIDAIRHRIPFVDASMIEPASHPVSEIVVIPWKRTAAQVFLFLIPGCISENEWLLLLGLIPIAVHVHQLITRQREPVALRQARRLYQKGNSRLALESVSKAIGSDPDYLPARLFKIGLLIGRGDLKAAEMALGEAYDLMTPKEIEEIRKWIETECEILKRKQWQETV